MRAAKILGRHDFTAFADKRLAADDSRIVVVERAELATADDLILFRIQASHFLWKMVRKIVSFLAEVGRGSERGGILTQKEAWQPTAPPSGLFLERILYPRETFDRALEPIVPVRS